MKKPENGKAVIKSLSRDDIKSVRLLGVGEVKYTQSAAGLEITLPERNLPEFINCFAVDVI